MCMVIWNDVGSSKYIVLICTIAQFGCGRGANVSEHPVVSLNLIMSLGRTHQYFLVHGPPSFQSAPKNETRLCLVMGLS